MFLSYSALLLAAVAGVSSKVFLDLDSIYVQDFQLNACDARKIDPISVANVTIQVGTDKKIIISGSLTTKEELTAPIKAAVVLKKKTWVGWIYIPCEKNLGSCDYDDLCSYGFPITKECPRKFLEHNVPCRCPVRPGTYTLPPSTFQAKDDRSVFSGKYKGNVFVSHNAKELACYNMNFVLVEK